MPNTDLERLQGSWRILSLELGGKAIPAAAFTSARVVLQGDRFTSTGMGVVYEGSVELRPDVSPKHFDLRFTAGPEAGNVNPGIYQLDGDSWTLCLNMRGAARPTEFVSGPSQALQVLQRVPDAPAVESVLQGETIPEFEGEWQMVSCTISGQRLPDPYLAGRRVVQGNLVTISMAGQVILEATYAANPNAAPKTLDYLLRKGGTQRGIWQFEGPILRTCVAAIANDRPTGFASIAGDGRILSEWRRTRSPANLTEL